MTNSTEGLNPAIEALAGSEIVLGAMELLKGKVVEYDGYISGESVLHTMETRLINEKILIVPELSNDPKKTILSIKDQEKPDSPLLNILINQNEVSDNEVDLQKAYDRKEINEAKKRLKTSIQISPVNIGLVMGKVKQTFSNLEDFDSKSVHKNINDIFKSLGNIGNLVSTVTVINTIGSIIDDLGKEAEKTRQNEVSNIRKLNEIYKQKLLSDTRCLSCKTPRLEEKKNCSGCGAPLEPRNYEDFKERLASAGIKI